MQAAVPSDDVAVVDDDRIVRRDIQGEKGAEAVDHQLSFARRLADEEAAGASKERRADVLHPCGEGDTAGRSEIGAIVQVVLGFTDVEDFQVARHEWGEQAVAVATFGADVLLEETFAIGETAHQRAHEAALHFAAQFEGVVHHDHGVAFAVDFFATAQVDVQERVLFSGGGKDRHGGSFIFCLD